jgi:glycosyltransferase involved in cell wall biosynthesis
VATQPTNGARLVTGEALVSKRMRVLMVVQSYFPFQERGGPVVKVRALARGLAHRGHRVTVLTADLGLTEKNGFGMDITRSRWGWRAEEGGVEAIYLSTLGHYRALTVNPHVVGFCGASLRQFDRVHFFGLYDLLGPAVSYFCRRLDIPYAIEPMGMYRPIVRSLQLKRLYHRLIGSSFIRGARFLIATSEQEKRELIDAGVADSRIAIRRNGVDLPEHHPTPGAFRRRWEIPSDAKMILFLGRLVSKKSPDLLLEAFARWKAGAGVKRNAVLVLAGPDEGDGFLARLNAMKSQYHLEQEVLFTGPLYDDAKWSAYRDADVFVLPSQNENFGNTAAEAAACGTPVIVTDRCGIASFVGGAGVVIEHDLGQLCDALRRFLEVEDARARYENGCKELVQKLSWEGPLDLTEDLYRKCVQEELGR